MIKHSQTPFKKLSIFFTYLHIATYTVHCDFMQAFLNNPIGCHGADVVVVVFFFFTSPSTPQLKSEVTMFWTFNSTKHTVYPFTVLIFPVLVSIHLIQWLWKRPTEQTWHSDMHSITV